jgi:DNA primase
LLSKFSKDIVVNFDPDTAGAAATDRSLSMLVQEEFNIRILRLESGFDPDLFVRRKGAAAYKDAIKGSVKYFDYLISRAMSSFPVRSPEGKVQALNYLLPHIQRIPNAIIRQELASDIAQKLAIDSAVLRRELKTAATRRSSSQIQSTPDSQVTPSEKVLVRVMSAADSEEAELRRNAVDALASESLHQGLVTETLLQTMLENPPGSPLELPLSDSDRQLMAKILMEADGMISQELLEGALEALRHRSWLAQRERDLKQKIAEAERRNDVSELMRLKQEKLELDRRLAAGQN